MINPKDELQKMHDNLTHMISLPLDAHTTDLLRVVAEAVDNAISVMNCSE